MPVQEMTSRRVTATNTARIQPVGTVTESFVSLPSFDGISALKFATKTCPDVPFIFVSGTPGEEVAIEALKIGATDYVLKTQLSRLVPSVLRALREATERAERKPAEASLRQSEAYLADAQRLSRTGSWALAPSTDNIVGTGSGVLVSAGVGIWTRAFQMLSIALKRSPRQRASIQQDYGISRWWPPLAL
jgi:DNA-binding NtrC family response regulator